MTTLEKFIIDDKEFAADFDLTKVFNFTISSIPRNYDVFWNEEADPMVLVNKHLNSNSKNLLLIDQNVFNLYGKTLEASKDSIFVAEATEDFKTLDGVTTVVDFLQKHQITKGENLIVVGGGIIQDIGAFVGAAYKRGIPWTYFPTTLLSMCDSCIGGKTGINHHQGKNQLALFSAPSKVIIDPNFLKTLSLFHINSGMGEILKLLATGGAPFLELFKQNINNGTVLNFNSYRPLILGALSVKKAIVEEDEFELNHRRSLNYGHTIGHAIEVLSKYKIPHGQAIVIGMIVVNELSYRHNLMTKDELTILNNFCKDLLNKEAFKIMHSLPTTILEELLKKDKKTKGTIVNFVVVEKIGKIGFLQINLDEKLIKSLEEIFISCFNNE